MCYIFHCRDANGVNNAKNVITRFYTDDEVVGAKKALWDECEPILGSYPERVSSAKRPAKVPHIDDIIEAVKTLDTLNKVPDVLARNLDRIPDRQPEEFTLLAALQRIDKLEKSRNHHEDSITQLTVDFMDLKDNVRSYVEEAAKKPDIITNNVLNVPQIVITPPPPDPSDTTPPESDNNHIATDDSAEHSVVPDNGNPNGNHSSAADNGNNDIHSAAPDNGNGRRDSSPRDRGHGGTGRKHTHRHLTGQGSAPIIVGPAGVAVDTSV